MKRFLLVLMVLVSGVAVAQHNCGFDLMHDKLMARDTSYANYVQQMNSRWTQSQNTGNNGNVITTGYGTEYVIPVVVHVIHTGGAVGTIYNPADTVIENAIEYMNETYAATYGGYPDTNNGGVRFPIRFELAKRAPSGCGTTNGIVRVDGSSLANYSLRGINANNSTGADDPDVKALSRWDSRDYYNIWVVNKIDSNDGTFGSFIAGYAYFPGATDTIDGTVILATRMKTGFSTLPHELGHAFSLYHTFEGDSGGGSCPPSGPCASTGDLVCDTDPHRRNSSTCPSDAATNICTSLAWSNNYTHKNIMDYSSCRDRFSAGQRTRWLSSLNNDRSGLASSWGAIDTSTNVVSASCTTTINAANATNSANMGPVKVVLNDLTSNSKGYNQDHFTNYIDRTCQQRATVIAGQNYTLTVNTETNRQDVQVYVDYDNDGDFNTTPEKIYDHNTALSSNGNETHSTTYSVPTTGITTCTPLRMRVIADWFTSTHVTNGCGQLDYGQAEDFTIFIRPASDTVTMYNSITTGSSTTCVGSSVTFSATASKTLSSPTYQWYVNSAPQSGATADTFAMSSLSAGTYYVQCKVKHVAACYTDSAFTNVVTLTVSGSSVTPSVSIASDKGTSICTGDTVTYTATPTNGGTSPSYQWKVNGSNVGTNSVTYTTSSLTNGQTVTCVMTSNDPCASPTTATSSGIIMTVTSTVTPSVAIASDKGNSVCSGETVTFTATPTNGGTSPSYQWKVNGGNVGTNSTTYVTSGLSNGDAVTCVMTSNATCASPTTATSTAINMTVSASVTPSVSIVSNKGSSICTGESVMFTATPINGGSSPTYQWKVNGSNVGTNSTTYTTSSLTNGQTVTCQMTSNQACASPAVVTSSGITMSVTSTVTPSVSIASNKGTSICTGDTVTFSATPTNGGTSPSYQWKVNGSNVGTNSATYVSNTLTNGQTVTCEMTSNATCASPTNATSNSIVMSVGSTVTPSVSIASDKGTSICSADTVTFTATPTNGGTSPSYQWKVNGSNVGTNSATYVSSTLTNGQTVTCEMTSNATCASPATATSNSLVMSVTSTVTPSVVIASNQGSSICSGTTVTFTATPTNGGGTPSYQWKLNGSNVGTNSTTYVNSTLSNGDAVTCEMTSSATCASPTAATSNTINMTVTGSTASVSIASNKGSTVCSGEPVTFTATPTNGGSTPSYQWKVNGSNAGANSSTFMTSSLSNGDVISCEMTSSSSCVSPATATSNSINMTVNPTLTPVIAITLTPNDTICAGTNVTFSANITNGGSTPAYQWKVNGSNVGTNSSTYATTSLADGDIVTCVLTSSETCVTQAMDTSNSINMTVNPILTPVVNISVSPNDTICDGTMTTFTATPTNGGSAPTYQWTRNGVTVGTNSTYSSSSLVNGDAVMCIMTTSEVCVSKTKDTSSTINMTVNPNLTPAVSITVSPNDTICAGTSVTFTATPTNGGPIPAYQWKVNGFNTGTNSNTFTSSALSNGDVVTVVLSSSEACVTSTTATSNAITMTVNPIITPLVTITPSPNDTICAGTMTTFTATPTNGGTSPTYQWQLNGVNAGTGATLSSTTFSDGDMVRCIMTSNGVCLTKPDDTSNVVTMTVIPNVTPAVVITHFPTDTICDGTNVTFTATPANGGTTPTYQWQVNGVNAGTNSTSFSTTMLANGDVVRCIMTSSITCVTKAADTSNEITIGVKSKVTPMVTISATPNDTICAGDNVTFTATATDAGVTPTYQWQVNGAGVGTNSATYMTSSLSDGDMVRCIVTTSDTCVTKNMDTSNVIEMTVKPILTPVVTIAVSPNDTVCDGDMVTFTATPTHGGTTPAYQWRVNGSNVGTNSATYATSTLSNGDVVDCIMTSSEMCVTKAADTSNSINMTVNPNLTPMVQVVVLPNDTVCDGTNVTFIATPTNGGTTPIYQWQINGSNVGTNATSYSSTALSDGDVVRCIMTSSEMCVTKAADTSDEIEMTIKPNLTPVVTISVSPDDTICDGTSTTFTATPTNGGTTPTYQWRLNGTNVGTNSNAYTTTTLSDGDVVDCIMTSSEMCVTKSADTSNSINMTVKPYVTPLVTIVESPNDTICNGTSVTFTATPTNGGTTPTYQWQVNGTNVGTNSSTYTSSTLANNDVVRCIMTSSEMCVTKAADTSNEVTMTVMQIVTPVVTIAESPNDTVCAGTLVSFIATPTNGGTTPTYQWKVNGNNVGINANGYSSNSFSNGDVVTCVLTSSEMCVTKNADTSNSVEMTIISLTQPSVGIAANTGATACVGSEVTFSANITNGGTAQTYQWRLNGTDISGATSSTYMSNTFTTGDNISLRIDITATCPDPDSAISNTVTMNMVNPSVDVIVAPNDTICDNQSAVFSVDNETNIGAAPKYQWKLNGVDQTGVIGKIFTMNTVGHQDVISVDYTGSNNCINAPAVPGNNTITMTVNPTAAPLVGITANPGNVVGNNDVVFFTSSVNTPNVTYQWRKNGVDIPGATGLLYTDTDPQDGDTISLFITTTDSCRTPDTALSNIIVMQVGVGVEEVTPQELFDNVSLAPNPNNGTFVLKGNLAKGRADEFVHVEVINTVGAVIYREQVQVRNHELETRIELGDKAHNGLHMVRITAEGRVHILKFIANR